jgi:predicted DNA-binding transcriptional regulator AlpA
MIEPNREVYINVIEVAALLQCHPVSVYRFKQRHRTFPDAVKIGNKNWWKRTEIATYIRNEFKKEGVT